MSYLLDGIAAYFSNTLGGFDALYSVAKKRLPEETLPHLSLFMKADSEKFGAEVKITSISLIKKQLIPEYVKLNEKKLKFEISKHLPNRTVDGLVDLYRRAGVDDYNWKPCG